MPRASKQFASDPSSASASAILLALRRSAPGGIGGVLVALVLGIALALLSVSFERTGPELLAYGNLCGPDANQSCNEPALQGGFPLAFLTDSPGISVEHRLSFGEDAFDPIAWGLDAAFYLVVVLGLFRLASRHFRPWRSE